MSFINTTNAEFIFIQSIQDNVAGSLLITLFILFAVLVFLLVGYRFNIEYIVLIVLPIAITFMAFVTPFIIVAGAMLLFVAVLFIKNIFFQ